MYGSKSVQDRAPIVATAQSGPEYVKSSQAIRQQNIEIQPCIRMRSDTVMPHTCNLTATTYATFQLRLPFLTPFEIGRHVRVDFIGLITPGDFLELGCVSG
jgi:hypothetical protein